jgi:Xaa-Pro aminopeptidase
MDLPYARRLARLRTLLRQEQQPALLVTKFVNVTYLTGFSGDDSYLLVTAEDAIMLSDFRYTDQLQEECPGLSAEIRPQGVSMLQWVVQAVRRAKVGRLAVEAESMSVGLFERLQKTLSKVELAATSGLVEKLRETKDREEIDQIRRSVHVAQRAFQVIRAQLRPEHTEKRVAAELEYQIRQFGGNGCSFAPIVAVGPRAALPHAVPTDRRMDESDFVLIDWGAKATRYASDLTRILVTGRIAAKLERVYGVVLKAQLRAIEAIRPGARMSDVDAVARTVIAQAGWGKNFGHGLGHGIGLEIHESPRLAVQQDQPLVAGMVVTVEPGIYLPGWGGVRIEDDVLVTRDGHEVLSDLPKELDHCLVR